MGCFALLVLSYVGKFHKVDSVDLLVTVEVVLLVIAARHDAVGDQLEVSFIHLAVVVEVARKLDGQLVRCGGSLTHYSVIV